MAYPLQSCLLQRGVILHFGLSKDWWPGCYPVDAVGDPSSILKGGPLIFPLSCDELQRIQKMKMAIMIAMSSGLPSWLVVLAAVLAPIVIALTVLTVMDWVSRPVSVEEYDSDPWQAFL